MPFRSNRCVDPSTSLRFAQDDKDGTLPDKLNFHKYAERELAISRAQPNGVSFTAHAGDALPVGAAPQTAVVVIGFSKQYCHNDGVIPSELASRGIYAPILAEISWKCVDLSTPFHSARDDKTWLSATTDKMLIKADSLNCNLQKTELESEKISFQTPKRKEVFGYPFPWI